MSPVAAKPRSIEGNLMRRVSTDQVAVGMIDPVRWPDVAVAVGPSGRAAIARVLFTRAVARLPLRVQFPDGHAIGPGGPGSPVMELRRPEAFFRRLGAGG